MVVISWVDNDIELREPVATHTQPWETRRRIRLQCKANPYDNAKAESFMKTLKYEEVYRSEYRDLAEARASIGRFLEKVYNEKRLHSALGYCPPVEFEQNLDTQPAVSAAAGGVF